MPLRPPTRPRWLGRAALGAFALLLAARPAARADVGQDLGDLERRVEGLLGDVDDALGGSPGYSGTGGSTFTYGRGRGGQGTTGHVFDGTDLVRYGGSGSAVGTPVSVPGYPASSSSSGAGGRVGIEPATRYQRCKQVLEAMLRAYVGQDIDQFMKQFSSRTEQDLGILRNAVLEDYQVETNINVDLELLQYWVTFDRLCVRIRWNRTATFQETGTSKVETGEGIYCFLRHDGFRMKLMFGSLPFGRSNRELQKQVTAGNPNPEQGSIFVDFDPLAVPIVLGLDFNVGGNGNVAFLDFEDLGAPVRKLESSTPLSESPQPQEDLMVYVPLGPFPTKIFVVAVNGARVANCGYGPQIQLDGIREVVPGSLGTSADTLVGPNFGVQTDEGRFVLLRVPDLAISNFLIAQVPEVNPIGSLNCP